MLFELAITLATTFMSPVQNKPQPPKTQIIYVKESKEPCTGVAPMECLQIKGVNDTDWSNFYTNISGFKYTPGYRYKLRVKITSIANPPADGSSLKYTLLKVLEKKKVNTNSSWTSLTSKKWILVKMDSETLTDGSIWIQFDPAKKRISGKSGCNGMMGGYTTNGNAITFSKTAGTLMACPGADVMRREATFMKLLGDQTFQYTTSGNTVNLQQNGNTVLQFRLEENSGTAGNSSSNNWAAIGDKKWTLSMINEGVMSNSGIWLQFNAAKKRFSGKGGCNNISGGYTVVKNKITFTQAMSTRMMCSDADVMRRESDFLKQLGGHSFTYTVTGETVNLYENGKLVMQFTVEDNGGSQPATAPGDDSQWAFIGSKKWSVLKLNDATLSNSGIWLEFDTKQKRFHGKGGCNSISGGYNATADQIKFTQGISTRMACIDAKVMRRETEFLKLISDNTFRYDIAEQTLNLYKDGKLVVIFGMQDKTL
ncbi:META domain-containing protein [Chitinophaga arvensicola]|uniref:Heat shock protein HslJ n=1 Tax=Chitinophaga arvensicola TaxID=29529 RepID=A0A1I0P4B4_9BACT|nr:META domain-containing protein [Chitinophaga arvensicola]SEW08896.1 Heat shock protein HslJ [Chitinophaga arvensicola]